MTSLKTMACRLGRGRGVGRLWRWRLTCVSIGACRGRLDSWRTLLEHMQQVVPEPERGEGQYSDHSNRNDPNHELENYTPAEHSQDDCKKDEHPRVMHGCSPPHEEDACDNDECQDG